MSSVCIDSVESIKDKDQSGVNQAKLLTGCVCGRKSGPVLYDSCFACSFYSTSDVHMTTFPTWQQQILNIETINVIQCELIQS